MGVPASITSVFLNLGRARSDRRARQDIHDLHLRYGRAVDTSDVDLIRTVFTDDAVVRYDPPGGQGIPMRGWDEFRAFWDWIQAPMECLHQFTNFTYEVNGSDGSYSCLLFAQHWPRGADFDHEVPLRAVGGRYTSRVRRCEDGWRIYDHRMQALWTSGDPEKVWPSAD